MAARGPQNGRWGLERGLPLGFGTLSLNEFFDLSTPSMRKVDDRGKKTGKKRGREMGKKRKRKD